MSSAPSLLPQTLSPTLRALQIKFTYLLTYLLKHWVWHTDPWPRDPVPSMVWVTVCSDVCCVGFTGSSSAMHGSPVKKRAVERTVSADCRGELDAGRSSETTSKVPPVILYYAGCFLANIVCIYY